MFRFGFTQITTKHQRPLANLCGFSGLLWGKSLPTFQRVKSIQLWGEEKGQPLFRLLVKKLSPLRENFAGSNRQLI
jgi:hypothetical protein